MRSNETKRTLGIVIIFHPDIDELIDNILSYIGSIDKLIIWRNSSLEEKEEERIRQYLKNMAFAFEGDGNNLGIAHPLNYAVSYAQNNGFDYLLSMDQDSKWVNFEQYINWIKGNKKLKCIYGPRSISVDDGEKTVNQSIEFEKRPYVITSGAIYPVEIFSSIGLFPEHYFIDAVDEEICYEAAQKGIDSIVLNNAFLLQHFGNHSFKKIFGKTIVVQNYSAFRYYHIIRNHLWLIKSGIVPRRDSLYILRNYVLVPPLKVLLFEKDKLKKIKSLFTGLVHGIRGK